MTVNVYFVIFVLRYFPFHVVYINESVYEYMHGSKFVTQHYLYTWINTPIHTVLSHQYSIPQFPVSTSADHHTSAKSSLTPISALVPLQPLKDQTHSKTWPVHMSPNTNLFHFITTLTDCKSSLMYQLLYMKCNAFYIEENVLKTHEWALVHMCNCEFWPTNTYPTPKPTSSFTRNGGPSIWYRNSLMQPLIMSINTQ